MKLSTPFNEELGKSIDVTQQCFFASHGNVQHGVRLYVEAEHIYPGAVADIAPDRKAFFELKLSTGGDQTALAPLPTPAFPQGKDRWALLHPQQSTSFLDKTPALPRQGIICPMMGALVVNDFLHPTKEGFICKEQTLRALLCVGISEEVAKRATDDNFDAVGGCINVFSMQFNKLIEHFFSTGVLEGKDRERIDRFLSFCDGGVCTGTSIRKAIAFFCNDAHTFNTNRHVTPGECEGSLTALFSELCPTGACSTAEWADLFLNGIFPAQFKDQAAFKACMLNGSDKEATRPIQEGQAEGCPLLHDPLMAPFAAVVCVVFMGAVCLKRSSFRKNGNGDAGVRPEPVDTREPPATVGNPVAPIGGGPAWHFHHGTHTFHVGQIQPTPTPAR